MRSGITMLALALVVPLIQSGCGSENADEAASGDDRPAASDTQPTSPRPATTSADSDTRETVGTTVRFSSGTASVDVTIGEDNPAVPRLHFHAPSDAHRRGVRGPREDQLPAANAQVQRLSRLDPKDGDLIYFVPWGNVGFY